MKNPFTLDRRAWSASILNVILIGIQLYHVWATQTTEGLSLIMLTGFVYMQFTYAQVGYRSKEWALFWGMAASVVVTSTLVCLTIYLRHLK